MKQITKTSLLTAVIFTAAGGAFAELPLEKTALKKKLSPIEKITTTGVKKTDAPASAAIPVDFSVKGVDNAAKATWSEDFNSGSLPGGWTTDNTTKSVWSIKKMSGVYAFTEYDAADGGSLYVEGDYRMYNRETTNAYSPAVEIGANATLEAYIGYSYNMDDYCRLNIEVSTDDFADDVTLLWSSKEITDPRTWAWHRINLDLSDFSGKTVKFRFTYGYGASDEIFKTGGYMGDFAIDGLKVTTAESIDKINVLTGEEINFIDLTPEGEATQWRWSFPGATPETSTEPNPTVYYTVDGSYDVTLEVTNSSGESASVTKPGFVSVTGTAPVAKIGLPATFRDYENRLPMIAPMASVTFTDASTGFPTSHEWEFSGVVAESGVLTNATGESVNVNYYFLHEQTVELEASNEHGTSTDRQSVSVEYEGPVTNLLPSDRIVDYFDMGDWGEFPGTNTQKFTRFAEKFSKPSRPVVVSGVYVYFSKAEAEEIYDQIRTLAVRLCKSENGVPGEQLDFYPISVYEIETSSTSGRFAATPCPFTENPVVDDEFFIVIDGFPEKNETCTVAIAMADFRGEANTTYMYKEKEGRWVDVSTYFPAGKNHTSMAVMPYITHSVISNLPMGSDPTVEFKREGGTVEYQIFSYMGWKPMASTGDWVKITSTPGEYTVDNITITAEPMPEGLGMRNATLTITDDVDTFEIPVVQTAESGVTTVITQTQPDVYPTRFTDFINVTAEADALIEVVSANGQIQYKGTADAAGQCVINGSGWSAGVYFVVTPSAKAVKIVKE